MSLSTGLTVLASIAVITAVVRSARRCASGPRPPARGIILLATAGGVFAAVSPVFYLAGMTLVGSLAWCSAALVVLMSSNTGHGAWETTANLATLGEGALRRMSARKSAPAETEAPSSEGDLSVEDLDAQMQRADECVQRYLQSSPRTMQILGGSTGIEADAQGTLG